MSTWWTEKLAAEGLAVEDEQQEQAPADEQPMTNQEYAEYRRQFGMDSRGIERVGRAPGHERQEFRGHTLEDGAGFPDWRESTVNERVYDSQLRDNRRQAPPGYQRPAAASEDEWS